MDNIAIVLGSKSVNATGLIRSLGMAGIKVTFISTYTKIESKFTRDYVKLPNNKAKWLDVIVEYCNSVNEKPVIFPTDDDTAYFLDDNYNTLKDCCYFSNARGKIRNLADKTIMAELAKKAGLNVAEFIKIDISKNTDIDMDFPIIIKPFAAFAGNKGDIKICENVQEYNSVVSKLIDCGYTEVMIQKFIKADDQYEVGIMGLSLPNREVIIPGIIHKIRSWPIDRGSTTYAQYVKSDNAVDIDALKRFVVSTGYVGIFDIELIVSKGIAWFVEINYRNGQYGFLPTAAGYNLPFNWCLGMIDGKVQPVKNIESIYYINERDDYLHVKYGNISKVEWKKQFENSSAYGVYFKGDQRPFIRQYVKIPDRIIILLKKIFALLKDLLIKEEWSIAIRKRDSAMLDDKGGLDKEFTVLKNSIRYWSADPFIISNGGKDYLFFEMFDRFKSKGLIGYREIIDGKAGKMQIAYETDCHLSFPFIFKKDNKFYMVPESSEGYTLDVLETDIFPIGWKVGKNIAKGRRFVDSALFEQNEEIYLFTQELKDGYAFTQLDLYKLNEYGIEPSRMNPIVDSSFNSRLAGRVFKKNGAIIRVSQDCSDDYGKQLNFNEIKVLSMNDYQEEYIKKITINDVKLDNNKKYLGIHTYNFNENYEVIDLKEKGIIRFGNVINIFYRIISKIKM